MGDATEVLKQQYDDFLRGERYNLVDRITTAIDDFQHYLRHTATLAADGTGTGVGCPRVKLKMSEIRSVESGTLSRRLRYDPLRHLRALEIACHEIALEHRPGYDDKYGPIKVAIAGPIAAQPYSPRQLVSSCLRQLVCVEGVAVRVSAVKSKIVESVHYCPKTNSHIRQEYVDATDPNLGLPRLDSDLKELPDKILNITSSVFPTKDKDGHLLETEFGLSTFKDHQTITLQEMPEKAPMGQLPRSVELVLDHDLVDKIKPGDRVAVVGVYRALATASQGQQTSSGIFRTAILVNSIQILGNGYSNLTFTSADIRSITSLAKRDDILSVLGRSIAPSIHGHAVIKRALILQLLSGIEKNLENGTHLRGDINILMVGDPSTAKSQLLRAAMCVAPLSISTTGKGSSGVGLTAAVTTDPETKERRLEAGAMVLGDRGLVCVDEFDKMGESDRVAIHEAMEQQTVTIAKAGIHASLNARCSVLAAANPVYGQYDRKRRIQENIGLPDSLLSRFDLLFIVLDQMNAENDRRIATHVIRGHQFTTDPNAVGYDSNEDDDSDDEDDVFHSSDNARPHCIWQRRGRYASKNISSRSSTETEEGVGGDKANDENEILQHDFLRKYLHYAKTRIKPVLSDAAREFISLRYAEMRARQDDRTLPVTARTLETIIRLATAHAKARLSSVVEDEPDCSTAVDILSFALYHENHRKMINVPGSGQEYDMTVSVGDKRSIVSDNENEDSPSSPQAVAAKKARSEKDLQEIKRQVWRYVNEESILDLNDIPKRLLDKADAATIRVAVEELANDNRIFLSEDQAYQL